MSDEQSGPAEGSMPRPSLQDYYGQRLRQLVQQAVNAGLTTSDAQAVVHDVFTKLIPKWERIPVERLDAYVGKSVRNGVTDVHRRRRREVPLAPEDLPEQAAPGYLGGEAVVEARDEHAKLRAQLGRLSERDRSLLLMQAQGVAPDEMAKRLGLTPGTMRVALHRAHARITKIRTSDAEDER
ncbi:RNA polymerase sigma factor [Streptomyces subrutilus]|uniref:RNA polymerase sigma factor n=1 Tax=Streptomyces subrutilus TaxID=36818 RepID=UPI0034083F17